MNTPRQPGMEAATPPRETAGHGPAPLPQAAAPAAAAPAATDQSPESIRGMFGQIAPTYDRLNRLLSGRLDQRWRRLAARAALEGLAAPRRVLDLACGTGDLAAALQRENAAAGAPAPLIIGADFTAPMLTRARAKFGSEPYAWVQADGLALPLADGAFDALTIGFGLRNMVDKPAALAEMARVLRPGGRIAILEFGKPRGRLWRALYDCYSFRVMPRLGRWISGSDAYGYLAGSIREFWDEAELARRMQAAGFIHVRARALMGGIVWLHCGSRFGERAATTTQEGGRQS